MNYLLWAKTVCLFGLHYLRTYVVCMYVCLLVNFPTEVKLIVDLKTHFFASLRCISLNCCSSVKFLVTTFIFYYNLVYFSGFCLFNQRLFSYAPFFFLIFIFTLKISLSELWKLFCQEYFSSRDFCWGWWQKMDRFLVDNVLAMTFCFYSFPPKFCLKLHQLRILRCCQILSILLECLYECILKCMYRVPLFLSILLAIYCCNIYI